MTEASTTLFALIREGSSDDGLVPHLRELVVRAGADEAAGTARRYKGTTAERLAMLMAEDGEVSMAFVHRDADSRNATQRRDEIFAAATSVGAPFPVVPVVPIQELEAWLLLDASEIRRVVGRPGGRSELSLPAPTRVETCADPKAVLSAALLAASDTTGRRRRREGHQMSQYRARLLEALDIDGPVSRLPAWQQLVADIDVAVAALPGGRGHGRSQD